MEVELHRNKTSNWQCCPLGILEASYMTILVDPMLATNPIVG